MFSTLKCSDILTRNLGWVVKFLASFKAELQGFTLISDRLEFHMFFAVRVSIDHSLPVIVIHVCTLHFI